MMQAYIVDDHMSIYISRVAYCCAMSAVYRFVQWPVFDLKQQSHTSFAEIEAVPVPI